MRSRLLAVLALVLAACGDPTAPSQSLAGKWTAAEVDVWKGVTFTLTESAQGVTGLWIGQLGFGSTTRHGAVTGSRNGDAATVEIDGGGMPCGYAYTITLSREGDRWKGTARSVNCGGGQSIHALPVTLSR